MAENELLKTQEDITPQTTHRSARLIAWACLAIVSFAFGSLATYVSVTRLPSVFALEGTFRSTEWMIASVALAAFTLGVGVAYLPYSWFRDDANRIVTERPVLYSRKSAVSRRRAWRRRH